MEGVTDQNRKKGANDKTCRITALICICNYIKLFKIVLVQKTSNIFEESLYQRDCYTKGKKTQSVIYWNYTSWWWERYKCIMKCVYQQHTKYHSSQLRGTGKKKVCVCVWVNTSPGCTFNCTKHSSLWRPFNLKGYESLPCY